MNKTIAANRTSFLVRLIEDERGATAIEYSVVAAGVAMAVAGAIRIVGQNVLNNLFSQLGNLFG